MSSNPVVSRSAASESVTLALLGIAAPGYQLLSSAYLREALLRDLRLPTLGIVSIDTNTSQDAWWIAYRILNLCPQPDFILISCYCWNMNHVRSLVEILGETLPNAKIILGGPEVSPLPERTLEENPSVFAVISGEGEKAAPNFIHSCLRGGDPSSVPGATVRTSKGIVLGPNYEVLDKLDQIPTPYTDANPPATDGSAYIETYRGCPHDCAYCFEGKGIKKIRSLSRGRIEQEIIRMATTPGMQSFSFIDSVFNLTRERLLMLTEILEPFAQRGLKLHTIEVDIERIDDDEADLLRRCGVVSVETGPQTTCARALELNNRSFNSEKYQRGVAACKKAGIAVDTDYIIGLPGDTVSSVLDSYRFAVNVDPHRIQASTLHVLPGTELSENAQKYGLKFDQNPPHELMCTSSISYNELRELEVFGSALAKLHRARRK